ncbi:ABC-2 type transport system permease protein [Georgenia satyanarayanai]|uniref:ABC-2 type transport system permease protein n=1 Tax=Georgenia satyanarayanai TaxID=860221 RepID=A0A2Y8ZXI1_9MICO|nr:ABC transporter permease [Georgenia satyanarayanai]PYG01882.1 ABC-2 type transport system permease protein [Georgenia satyanarayanai]SSA36685.1 ABC-2 type transport system permease protein [Georgenia satyanarayanai]
MTTTTLATSPASTHRRDRERGSSLVGTGTLLRFMLRRDRVRFPAWVLGLTMLLAYFATALGLVLDEEALATFAAFAANPVMALIGGPGYGFDDITLGRFLVGTYGAFIMIGAALMSITTVSRHTRVEEQTGRAELVRANVVGRHAQLAAALVLVVLMNAAMTVLLTLTFHTSRAAGPLGAALLFACSIGAVGLVFAGVAAITVQLSPYSRAASGVAGAVLAAAFIVRGLGDMSATQGGNLGWLSWLSPFGWSQQTAPLTLDRWWPLTVSLAAALALAAAGFALQSRRDLAAGILPDRLGSASAPGWLRSSLTLAYRLQRSGLAWWSFALLLAGITFGAFVQPMAENASGMPAELLAVFGGSEGMVEGYLGFMGIYLTIIVAVFAILSVQSLRGEEQGVRTEPVLAAAVSRTSWVLSWVLVAALGTLWLLALAGLGVGLGAGLGTGDWDLVGSVVLGHAAHAPVTWLLLGLAVALYGLAPRLTGLTWVVFVYGAVLGLFGDMLQLEDAVLATSVFRHVGQYPAEEISWGAVALLTLIAAILVAIGTAGFRRRDLITA